MNSSNSAQGDRSYKLVRKDYLTSNAALQATQDLKRLDQPDQVRSGEGQRQ